MKALRDIIAGGLMTLAGAANAAGDAAKGAAVFRQCAACHSVEKDASRIGPSLHGVVGRAVASILDFQYSEAMKAFGAAGHRWDEATLSAYLQAPQDYIPDIEMRFAGLKRQQDIADVIAYLRSAKTQP